MIYLLIALLCFNGIFLMFIILKNNESEKDNSPTVSPIKTEPEIEHKLLKMSTSTIEFNKEENRIKVSKTNIVGVDNIDETSVEIQRNRSISENYYNDEAISEEDANRELSEAELDTFQKDSEQSEFTEDDYLGTPTNDDISNIVNYEKTDSDKLLASIKKVTGTEFLNVFQSIDDHFKILLEEIELSGSVSIEHTEGIVSVPKETEVKHRFDIDKLRKSLVDRLKK